MRRRREWDYWRLASTHWSSLTMSCRLCLALRYTFLTLDRHRYTPSGTFVAAFHFTIALLPAGPSLISHPPVWYKPELVKTEKELEDEELTTLLTKKLREDKKKNKKKKGEGEGEGSG